MVGEGGFHLFRSFHKAATDVDRTYSVEKKMGLDSRSNLQDARDHLVVQLSLHPPTDIWVTKATEACSRRFWGMYYPLNRMEWTGFTRTHVSHVPAGTFVLVKAETVCRQASQGSRWS